MSIFTTTRGVFALQSPLFDVEIPTTQVQQPLQTHQRQRDGPHHRHCTLLNPKTESSSLGSLRQHLPANSQDLSIQILGLGTHKGAVYILLVSCAEIQVARANAGLGWKDLHVTIGFTQLDIHEPDAYKGPASLIPGQHFDEGYWESVHESLMQHWKLLAGFEPIRKDLHRFTLELSTHAIKECQTHGYRTKFLNFRAMVYSQTHSWDECYTDALESLLLDGENLEAVARVGEAAFKLGMWTVSLKALWKCYLRAGKNEKVKSRMFLFLKKLWVKGVVNVEVVDEESSGYQYDSLKLTADEMDLQRKARVGLVEDSISIEQTNAVIAKPKLLLTNGHKLPRRFSWVVPLLLAGMSTPKCEQDIIGLKQLGIRTVITLTEEEPLPQEWFENHDMMNHFWPVTNYYPPSIAHADRFNQILLQHHLEKKGGILVHCGGGIGRAGSLLGTYLIRYGLSSPPPICSRCEMRLPIYCEDTECAFGTGPRMSARDAIDLLRAIRPASIETEHQEHFLSLFASELFKRSGSQTRIYSPLDQEPSSTPGEIKCVGQRTPSPLVMVLCGLPGSGKSWFTETLTKESKKWVSVSQDSLGSKDACERLAGTLAKTLGNPTCIVIDKCNPTATERGDWLKLMGLPKNAVLVHFDAGKDVCIERAAWRLNHPTVRSNAAKGVVSSFAAKFETPSRTKDHKGFQAIYTVSSFADSITLLNHFGIKISSETLQTLPGFIKYPRTRHLFDLGAASRDDLILDDLSRFLNNTDPSLKLAIEEKIDGANMGFRINPEEDPTKIICQNRTHVVTSSSHIQFQGLSAWIFRNQDALQMLLEGGKMILFGEWMVARHSVSYDLLPDYFVAFDLYDVKEGKFLSRARFDEVLEGTRIAQVPRVSFKAPLTKDGLLGMIQEQSAFSSKERREGLVVRLDGVEWMEHKGKIVRADFICGNDHWISFPNLLTMTSTKPVMAVDMDEVLCGTAQALVDFHNANYSTKLTVKDFVSYNYEEVWGGTKQEAVEKVLVFFSFSSLMFDMLKLFYTKVRLFYESDHFSERMAVVPGAFEALSVLKEYYDLVIITSRQEFVQKETHDFINLNYPGIFKEVHFANHHLTPEEAARMVSKTKGELCREVGATILIDDSLHHVFECAEKGIKVFLFDHEGAYQWNKLSEDAKLPVNATRVHEWAEVVKALVPGK
ncbi:UNVERIFIED_CONTAM: hypothetical protein HDU68_010158 [Siphonaria sp. JEL0065]|nr:hypothetical protein HDU68_010158 [Siphonaria sp. JEL0065]